jgi:ABC-type proline/glycine betaine transport system ATPase subunit
MFVKLHYSADVGPYAPSRVRQVSYSVGTTSILSNLNLTVDQSEILVLLGESGCGKTTTLKLVNRY